MGFNNVNVNVSGSQSIIKALQNYNTVILKPNIVDNRNVLTQEMMSERHTKYIIRWNYSLEGATINVPEDCIIEFAGGTIDNGTIVGNNTMLMYSKPIDEVCLAERQGTFIYNTTVADEEDITSESGQLKFKDRPATDGMGKVILRKNVVSGVNTLTQSMLQATNTIYVIQYDFTLGEDITVPANCVLEFDGGSVSGAYTLTGNNTTINAGKVAIFTNAILAGSWKNKEMFVSWFGLKTGTGYSSANTTALNSYMIPSCTNTGADLVVDMPIYVNDALSSISNFNFVCNDTIYYNGLQNINAVINIIGGGNREHHINIRNVNTEGTYEVRKEYPIAGVYINNLCISKVYINLVKGFTKGCVIASDNMNVGCFSNMFYLNYIANSYKNLVFEVDNGGWINENLFINGRLQNDTDNVFFSNFSQGTIKNIAISFTNLYHTVGSECNNNVFVKTDIEDAGIGIYVGEKMIVKNNRFVNIRNEKVTKLIDDNGIEVFYDSKSVMSLYDATKYYESNSFRTINPSGYSVVANITLQGIVTNSNISCYTGTHFSSWAQNDIVKLISIKNYTTFNSITDNKYINFGGYARGIGYLLKKCSSNLSFLLTTFGKSGATADCKVVMVDDSFNVVEDYTGMSTNAFIYRNMYSKGTITFGSAGNRTYDFWFKNIPNSVKYICIIPVECTCGSTLNVIEKHELVDFENELVGNNTSTLFGMYDSQTASAKRVVSCFDTANGKLLWRKEGAWVDATGTPV